jgi:hypothetical protein
LPQTAVQLLSLTALHPTGQHASSLVHRVCVPEIWQTALQVPPLAIESNVHACCAHEVGHVAKGSHVSPGSTTPLPHVAGQSTSRFDGDVLQPGGQQPSIVVPLQGSCVVEHRALHVAGDPVNVLTSQHWPGVHAVGHVPGGSQVSPAAGSIGPSPQPAQSESFWAVHPTGQHLSLPVLEHVFGATVHTTLQVAAVPVWESAVQSF